MPINNSPVRWCIVQSDSDRSHLSALNRTDKRQIPIQYCCVGERLELIQRAMQRALRISSPGKVIVTVAEDHRTHWMRTLWSVPCYRRVIDMSSGRQTITLAAAAALIERTDPGAVVVVTPADAFCANDWALHSGIQSALRAVDLLPGHLLALTMEAPRQGEPQDYLVAGAPDGLPGHAVARCVRRPAPAIGRRLAAAGACVNSGVYITRLETLTAMLEEHWPSMMAAVRRIVSSSNGELVIPARFDGAEFHRPWRHTWLQRPITRLRAVPVVGTGWSSLSSLAAIERLAMECPEFTRLAPGPSPELLSAYARLARWDSYHHLIPTSDGEPIVS
jgi:mannose-1-phosphate guanylyltransferase